MTNEGEELRVFKEFLEWFLERNESKVVEDIVRFWVHAYSVRERR